ncbi:MAG: homocysteine S-methyltransferase family protein [Rhizobiales bacterium]|nr:homocysteine S-methyltransferase family protein [Hyphomicrobiales bacterium]
MMPDKMTILDGSMGTALRDFGVEVPDYRKSVWSALALIKAPDIVQQLHHDYICAGADVITTSNYAVTVNSLATEGLEHRLTELTELSCRLAIAARNRANMPVRLAGSLPPLNVSYRPDMVGPFKQLVRQYQQLAELLAPYVDIFLCETMTTISEARAAAGVASRFGKPVWLSFSLEDDSGSLRSGEPLAQAAHELSDLGLDAVLINCCSARAVKKGLPQLRAFNVSALGAYANPFRRDPPDDHTTSGKANRLCPDEYLQIAEQWAKQGASIIGGCCGTDPEYIAALRTRWPTS